MKLYTFDLDGNLHDMGTLIFIKDMSSVVIYALSIPYNIPKLMYCTVYAAGNFGGRKIVDRRII
jgi:hypothetical protein